MTHTTRILEGQALRSSVRRILPTMIPVFFWLLVSGVSVWSSIVATSVIGWIICWGYLVLSLLIGEKSILRPFSLWIVGPSFCVGTFTIFLLRLITNRDYFLLVFTFVPVFWFASNLWRANFKNKSTVAQSIGPEPSLFQTLQLANLMGLGLVVGFGNWDWVLPIVISTMLIVVANSRISSENLRKRVNGAALLVIGVVSAFCSTNRPQDWFRQAEGIPYDETILASISHGLVAWGPLVDPLASSRSGISVLIYHHLIYLDSGLVDYFADLEAYKSLLIVGPIMIAFAISTSLLQLIQRWSMHSKQQVGLSEFVFMGSVTFILGLVGPGFSSLSSLFGVAALLVAIYLVAEVFDSNSTCRHVAILSVATGMLAFAKFPYLYVVPLIVVGIGWQEFRKNSRAILTSVTVAGFIVLLSILSSNNEADRLQFRFFSNSKFGGVAGLTKHTLLSFLDVLVSPIALGISGLILALLVSIRLNRREYYAYGIVVLVALATGVTLVAAGGGEDYFMHPAQILVLLTLVRLATEPFMQMRFRFSYLLFGTAAIFVLTQISERLDSKTFSSRNMAATLVTIVAVGASIYSRLVRRKGKTSTFQYTFGLLLTLVLILSSVNSVNIIYPELPGRLRSTILTSDSDWYGNEDFREIAEFVNASTDRNSLHAFSICRTSFEFDAENCDAFRPAAVIERRFLSLAKKFPGEKLSAQKLQDLTLSQSIGIDDAMRVKNELRLRNVQYVITDRSRVNDNWQKEFQKAGALLLFANDGYSLFELW